MEINTNKFRINGYNVALYKANRDNLPCIVNRCAVAPLCFSEKQATKRAKYLRYTIEFRDPCVDAVLFMHQIDLLPMVQHDFEVPIKEMNKMPINDLFGQATEYMYSYDNPKDFLQAYFMLIKVIEKNPNFIDNNGEDPYFLLGEIFFEKFFHLDLAIQLYSKSINLAQRFSLLYERRGICYLFKDNWEEALEDFKAGSAIDEGNYYCFRELIEDIENRQKGLPGNPEYDHLFE